MHPSFSRQYLPSGWRALPVALVVAFLALSLVILAGGNQRAEAAASGSSAFDINGGNPVTVGQSYGYVYTVVNSSTPPQDVESVTLTSITGYPACDAIEFSTPLCNTAANQNPGVFTPDGTGTGVVGTACAGETFNISVSAAGLWTFTPVGGPVVLGPANVGGPAATCAITGNVDVNSLPDDAQPAVPGIQTRQLSLATGTTNTTSQQFEGLGSASLTVLGTPDLEIDKTPDGAVIPHGDDATFTIVVSNNGEGTAENVTLNDPLPNSTLDWSISGGDDAADCEITGAVGSQVLECEFGDLDPGDSVNVEITSSTDNVVCDETNTYLIPNEATASADNHADVSDPGDITVECEPDLEIDKSPDGEVIQHGDAAIFTIVITNNGPGTAENVTLNDELPNSTLDWSIDSSDPTCNITGVVGSQVLECEFGDLAPGASVEVQISSPTTNVVCGPDNTYLIENLAIASADNHADVEDPGDITVECEPPGDFEGCTPGFWRQSQHFWAWEAAGVSTDALFSDVFGRTIEVRSNSGAQGRAPLVNDPTLLQAVWAQGGGDNMIARHAVAAYLNSLSDGVNYPYTTAEVIAAVQAALDGDTTHPISIQDIVEANELGCGLGNDPGSD